MDESSYKTKLYNRPGESEVLKSRKKPIRLSEDVSFGLDPLGRPSSKQRSHIRAMDLDPSMVHSSDTQVVGSIKGSAQEETESPKKRPVPRSVWSIATFINKTMDNKEQNDKQSSRTLMEDPLAGRRSSIDDFRINYKHFLPTPEVDNDTDNKFLFDEYNQQSGSRRGSTFLDDDGPFFQDGKYSQALFKPNSMLHHSKRLPPLSASGDSSAYDLLSKPSVPLSHMHMLKGKYPQLNEEDLIDEEKIIRKAKEAAARRNKYKDYYKTKNKETHSSEDDEANLYEYLKAPKEKKKKKLQRAQFERELLREQARVDAFMAELNAEDDTVQPEQTIIFDEDSQDSDDVDQLGITNRSKMLLHHSKLRKKEAKQRAKADALTERVRKSRQKNKNYYKGRNVLNETLENGADSVVGFPESKQQGESEEEKMDRNVAQQQHELDDAADKLKNASIAPENNITVGLGKDIYAASSMLSKLVRNVNRTRVAHNWDKEHQRLSVIDMDDRFTWDYALVFKMGSKRDTKYMQDHTIPVVKALVSAGLQVALYRGSEGKKIFCMVGATEGRLRQEANRISMEVELNYTEMFARLHWSSLPITQVLSLQMDGDPLNAKSRMEWRRSQRAHRSLLQWVAPDIVVRITDSRLFSGRYYEKLARVVSVAANTSKPTRTVLLELLHIDHGSRIHVDESDLETVSPQVGRNVLAIKGPFLGKIGVVVRYNRRNIRDPTVTVRFLDPKDLERQEKQFVGANLTSKNFLDYIEELPLDHCSQLAGDNAGISDNKYHAMGQWKKFYGRFDHSVLHKPEIDNDDVSRQQERESGEEEMNTLERTETEKLRETLQKTSERQLLNQSRNAYDNNLDDESHPYYRCLYQTHKRIPYDYYSVFAPTQRLTLIRSIIEADREVGGAFIDLAEAHSNLALLETTVLSSSKKNDSIIGAFPLHNRPWKKNLSKIWYGEHSAQNFMQQALQPPLDQIAEYFGASVAFYFAFMAFYNMWMLGLAIVGLVFFAISFAPNFDFTILAIFGPFVAVWSAVFFEFWKREESKLRVRWGMTNYQDTEAQDEEFEGQWSTSPITGLPRTTFPFRERRIRQIVSNLIILALIMGLFGLVVFLFYIREQLILWSPNWGSYLGSALFGAQIFVTNELYWYIANGLTRFENYEKQSEKETQLMYKLYFFEFINNYAVLFYFAFFATYTKSGCPNDDCMEQLRVQMGGIFVSLLVINNVKENLMPWVKRKVQQLSSNAQAEVSHPEKEFYREPFRTFQDFDEVSIQFGYVSLFVIVFPLAPALALLNNLLEIQLDAQRLCELHRRPDPRGAYSVGTWLTLFNLTSVIGVLTNCALAFLQYDLVNSELLQDVRSVSSTFDNPLGVKLISFLIFEHALIAIKIYVAFIIKDDAPGVLDHIEQQKYIIEELIGGKKAEKPNPEDDINANEAETKPYALSMIKSGRLHFPSMGAMKVKYEQRKRADNLPAAVTTQTKTKPLDYLYVIEVSDLPTHKPNSAHDIDDLHPQNRVHAPAYVEVKTEVPPLHTV